MIHDIEEEKNRINRRHNDFSGDPSEEALMELIRQVESEEMLHAPRHLKGNVIDRIRQERRALKKRQLFTYRAKVLTAMAAALTVLILMPNDRAENALGIPIGQQAEAESLEQIALRRRQDIDADWERYLVERERGGGIKGFFSDINDRVTEFGTNLYNNINQQQN